MIAAAITFLILLFAVLGWVILKLSTELLAAYQSRQGDITQALAAQSAAHAVELERVHAIYAKSIEMLGNISVFGTAQRAEAQVAEPERGAAERIAERVDQEVIARAVVNLRDQYASVGVTDLTDDELEQEAISIMSGSGFSLAPATLARVKALS